MRLQVVYHSGALPGLSTLVSFLPSDEIGITLFANGESKAETVMLIMNRILDSALHLTSTVTSTRFVPFSKLSARLTHGPVQPLATSQRRSPMLGIRRYLWMPLLGRMLILVTDRLRYVAHLAHPHIVPRFESTSPSSIAYKATQALRGNYSPSGLACGRRTSVCGTRRVPSFKST